MWRRADVLWRRNISVFVWTVPLLLGPLLTLGHGWQVPLRLALVAVIAASAVVIGLRGRPDGRHPSAVAAFTTMFAACVAATAYADQQWLPIWVLLANAAPVVLRGRWLAPAGVVVVSASAWAAWIVEPHQWSRVWTEAFVVALALLANTAFTRLVETVDELHRTRAELARAAVSEERERFSRDLHDLLGHTLSVIVVKAQAVRRLVATDPEAATAHAADIERVGRAALVDVRQAVDAMRAPSLPEELVSARDALETAGIRVTVEAARDVPEDAGTVLAWALREAVTNVLRHSAASACSITVSEVDGEVCLAVTDDGVGSPTAPTESSLVRAGGLEGLRDRVRVAHGSVEAGSTGAGFTLVARVPTRLGAHS